MEDEHEGLGNGDNADFNPHGIDLDALPERSHDSEVTWLDLNGLTARESLGLMFEKNFAYIRK
jgi:hypothetical protein